MNDLITIVSELIIVADEYGKRLFKLLTVGGFCFVELFKLAMRFLNFLRKVLAPFKIA